MKNRFIIPLLIALALALAGCGGENLSEISQADNVSEIAGEISADAEITDPDEAESADAKTDESDLPSNADGEYGAYPVYDGSSPYAEINNNIPYFDDDIKKETKAFETYSDLDSLGRCGTAFANVCEEIMPDEERGEIGQIRPSGWHTVKYTGYVDGNYLYNRCHLIAYMLSGENANEENLITGTRYMNVTGMLPFEESVNEYIEENPENHVLYRVTPVFTGDNAVADGVLMEAYSVEDAGKGIEFCVYCFNVQPGIIIDYATGESEIDEDYSEINSEDTAEALVSDGQGEDKDISEETTYVINTNTKKFHCPDCPSVTQMSEKNMEETTKSRQELIEEGYSPCGNCKP